MMKQIISMLCLGVGLLIGVDVAMSEVLPLHTKYNKYEIVVSLPDGSKEGFQVDTGATTTTMSQESVERLRKSKGGEVIYLGKRSAKIADGSEVITNEWLISGVKLASLVNLSKIVVSTFQGSHNLLGMNVLLEFETFTFDTRNDTLIVGKTLSSIIHPYERVGNFFIGMSKEDTLKLGNPQEIGTIKSGVDRFFYTNPNSDAKLAVFFKDNRIQVFCFTNPKFKTREGLSTENFDTPNQKLIWNGGDTPTFNYKTGGLYFVVSSRVGCVTYN